MNVAQILLIAVISFAIFTLINYLREKKKNELPEKNRGLKAVSNRAEDEQGKITINESMLDNILEQKTILQEQLFKIIDAAQQFTLELDIDSVCKTIFEEIDRFFFIQRFVFLVWDKNLQKLSVKYFRGLDPQMQNNIKDLHLNAGESISGMVAKNKMPLLIQSFDNESYYQRINKEEYFSGSFISLPILAKDELLGIINIINKKTGKAFEKQDLYLINGIVAIGTVALKNIQLNKSIQEHYVNVIITLAKALDARDHYTKSHSENVEKSSVLIAKEIGLSNVEIEYIHKAALLHDIGKIAISDNILKKTTSLTNDEFEIIKNHPLCSEEIISSISFLGDSIKIVRHHHERYDGKGYPDGIKGGDIELGARIISVADSYDAMTSDRTYRKALSQEQAVQEIAKGKGTQFDPKVVDAFMELIKRREIA
ncbi:MAG: HD domain-containing phosphohydrolase [Candidatus Omnitrophota bacterium]